MKHRSLVFMLWFAGSLLGGLLLGGPLAWGQAPAPAPPPPAPADVFIDTIDVNVVNVEVVVTDKQGNPVVGLKKEDFELFEDGRKMEITNFYAVEGGKPTTPGLAPTGPAEPEIGGPPGLAPLKVPEDQRLNLVVFIDNFNITPLNRNRVMRELRQFLTQNIRSEDRVMLVTYLRSLKVEQPFTSDPRLVGAALSRLEKMSGQGNMRDTERRSALQQIDDSRDEFSASAYARVYAESVFNDLTFTIRALKEFIGSLAGLPGRKMILHVSDGIPMVAAQEVFAYVDGKYPNSGVLNEAFSYDASRQFKELVALANANRVTFYPMDAAGLRTYSHISAENPGVAGQGTLVDSTLIANLQDTLHFLANGTGGKAIVNRNRILPALATVAQDFRNYYSLGFNPAHAGTGRLYDIKVKVNRKGLDLRYRESYRDKSAESRMSDSTLASLSFDFQDNVHGLEIEVGRAVDRDQGRHYLVPIKIRIPLGKLTMMPTETTFEGRVRLFIAAQDNEGDTSEVQEANVPISIPKDQVDTAKEQYYVYSLELLMRKGGHDLAVGMRDDLAGTSTFVRRRVNVEPAP